MAYKLLDNADLQEWNTAYGELSNAYAAEANKPQRNDAELAKLTARMQSLATQVEEHLSEVGRQLRTYYDQHLGKVNNWERLSEQTIAAARKSAADYKKDTSTGLPPQLQQAVEDLGLWDTAIEQDAVQLGAAWFGYRADGAMNRIPDKHKAAFRSLRSKLMDEQKPVTTIRTKIKGYKAEAEGLVKVAAKATMKAGIKAGTGVQRPISQARDEARALAQDMADELERVRNPPGTATAPNSIRTTKQSIRENSQDRNYTKTPGNVTLLTSRKNLLKTGIKLMHTRVAAMEKLLAVRTKAFRSNELSDATVKADMKRAQKSLKDAQTELKATEAHASKGLEYAAAIEARWETQKS